MYKKNNREIIQRQITIQMCVTSPSIEHSFRKRSPQMRPLKRLHLPQLSSKHNLVSSLPNSLIYTGRGAVLLLPCKVYRVMNYSDRDVAVLRCTPPAFAPISSLTMTGPSFSEGFTLTTAVSWERLKSCQLLTAGSRRRCTEANTHNLRRRCVVEGHKLF